MATHKVLLLIFRKYRPPSSPVSARTILAYTLSPSTSVRIKGYMREIYFVNSYQKDHKLRYKKRQYCKCYRKTSNQNIKKSLRFKGALFNLRKRWEWHFLAVWIANFLDFYFAKNLWKNNNDVRTLTAQPPPLPIRANTLLAGPPLPRPIVHTLWMTPQYIVLYGNMEWEGKIG